MPKSKRSKLDIKQTNETNNNWVKFGKNEANN